MVMALLDVTYEASILLETDTFFSLEIHPLLLLTLNLDHHISVLVALYFFLLVQVILEMGFLWADPYL
jgi:hypothetical protein